MAISSESHTYYATGRRKTSVARVWVFPGSGKITINRRDAERYVTRSTKPANTSWADGSGCGFMAIVTSSVLSLRPPIPSISKST